jgi:hypothetical protein
MIETTVLVLFASALVGLIVGIHKLVLVILQITREVIEIIKTIKKD